VPHRDAAFNAQRQGFDSRARSLEIEFVRQLNSDAIRLILPKNKVPQSSSKKNSIPEFEEASAWSRRPMIVERLHKFEPNPDASFEGELHHGQAYCPSAKSSIDPIHSALAREIVLEAFTS
jgi:hypothetical protein